MRGLGWLLIFALERGGCDMGKRGPKPMEADAKKSVLLAIRLRPDEAEQIKQSAAKCGESVSEFVRRVIEEELTLQ